MGRIVNDVQKSLNIECDSGEEASKLANYLDTILNYLKGELKAD
jgi:ABC-type phosphate/phosphonate transport system substrate-binding protein